MCARARDWLWSNSESVRTSTGRRGVMQRENPDTWLGPFTPENGDMKEGEFQMEFLRKDRWIVHQFGGEELFIDLLPRRCMGIAEQLLGKGQVVSPAPGLPKNVDKWGRRQHGGLHGCGLYATLPMEEGAADGPEWGEAGFPPSWRAPRRGHERAGIHVDDLACHLGCVGYIDDVPADGGGFGLYPCSHRRLFHTFEYAYARTTTDDYKQQLQ